MHRPGGGPATLWDTGMRPLRSRYSYRMISPIRGDFTGFRVQVPPRTHHDQPLTCGYAMGRHSPELAQGCFCRSGPWGFKSGPGCGTITAIVSQTDLQILRDAPSGKPWPAEDTGRMRRGWILVSGSRTCRTPADCGHPVDATGHPGERRHVGFPREGATA